MIWQQYARKYKREIVVKSRRVVPSEVPMVAVVSVVATAAAAAAATSVITATSVTTVAVVIPGSKR